LFIDESHMSIPQIRGMYGGDHSRKETLVEYGFRLPSAMENRPLQWHEFERLIRPTGLLDPSIEVKPTRGQVDDLIGEINARVRRGERALVTTLTKRMAEDLADYLREMGIRVHY